VTNIIIPGESPDRDKREEELYNRDKRKVEEQITNAYHFGQFFTMHILLKIKDVYDLKHMHDFLEARYKSFVKEFPNFYNQMIKTDKKAARQAEDEYRKFFGNQMEDQQGDNTKL